MTNWIEAVQLLHARHFSKTSGQLVFGAPLSVSDAAAFREVTAFDWTPEFFELYQQANGIAMASTSDTAPEWNFLPTTEIARMCDSSRAWFVDTHPQIAKAFFPFFDWRSGDTVGYLNLEGVPPILFAFEHEQYEFDAKQDWSEFLQPAFETLLDFVSI